MTAVISEEDQQRALHRAVNRLREEDPIRSASVAVVPGSEHCCGHCCW